MRGNHLLPLSLSEKKRYYPETYEGSKNTQNLIEMLHDKMSPALEKNRTSLAEKLALKGKLEGEMELIKKKC